MSPPFTFRRRLCQSSALREDGSRLSDKAMTAMTARGAMTAIARGILLVSAQGAEEMRFL